MNKKEHYKFKEWIELEDKKEQVIRAVEEVKEDFPEIMIDFLSTALLLPKEDLEKMFWVDLMKLFAQVCQDLVPKRKLPILSTLNKEKQKKDIWDYDNRSWNFYTHLLAKSYGWTMEYIADLPVEDAIAQVQEILTDQQLQREFTWSMSEASVIYDSKTKTSRPNPLPRPYWMKQIDIKSEKEVPIEKFKLKKSYLPVGAVDYQAISAEFKPKEFDNS
jgi:hypothetical protein